MGEILGSVILGSNKHSSLNPKYQSKSIKVIAKGDESEDGRIAIIDKKKKGKAVKVLENLDTIAYYGEFAKGLGRKKQSAVIGSFDEQRRIWNRPPKKS